MDQTGVIRLSFRRNLSTNILVSYRAYVGGVIHVVSKQKMPLSFSMTGIFFLRSRRKHLPNLDFFVIYYLALCTLCLGSIL